MRGLTPCWPIGPRPVAPTCCTPPPIGSNTILEGKGARTALITTRGFRDVLEIRDLRMPRAVRHRTGPSHAPWWSAGCGWK